MTNGLPVFVPRDAVPKAEALRPRLAAQHVDVHGDRVIDRRITVVRDAAPAERAELRVDAERLQRQPLGGVHEGYVIRKVDEPRAIRVAIDVDRIPMLVRARALPRLIEHVEPSALLGRAR